MNDDLLKGEFEVPKFTALKQTEREKTDRDYIIKLGLLLEDLTDLFRKQKEKNMRNEIIESDLRLLEKDVQKLFQSKEQTSVDITNLKTNVNSINRQMKSHAMNHDDLKKMLDIMKNKMEEEIKMVENRTNTQFEILTFERMGSLNKSFAKLEAIVNASRGNFRSLEISFEQLEATVNTTHGSICSLNESIKQLDVISSENYGNINLLNECVEHINTRNDMGLEEKIKRVYEDVHKIKDAADESRVNITDLQQQIANGIYQNTLNKGYAIAAFLILVTVVFLQVFWIHYLQGRMNDTNREIDKLHEVLAKCLNNEK